MNTRYEIYFQLNTRNTKKNLEKDILFFTTDKSPLIPKGIYIDFFDFHFEAMDVFYDPINNYQMVTGKTFIYTDGQMYKVKIDKLIGKGFAKDLS